jgi:uncharacterized damage-inducible protein DinB
MGLMLNTYLSYGQWANRIVIDGLSGLSDAVLDARQPVVFGSIRRTFHHLLVIGQVWRAHLWAKPWLFQPQSGNPPPMERWPRRWRNWMRGL